MIKIVLVDRAAPRICPFCRDVLGDGKLVACSECDTGYHAECAGLHGHCVLLGCRGTFATRAARGPAERFAVVVRGLGAEPTDAQVAAVDDVQRAGRYEARYRLVQSMPLVLGYYDAALVPGLIATLERTGLEAFAVEAAELAQTQFFLVRGIERQGSRLVLRAGYSGSPHEVGRELDLDAPRFVVRGQYREDVEQTVREPRQNLNFRDAQRGTHVERTLRTQAEVPFVHVYQPGEPVPLAFELDRVKDYRFLGDDKQASSRQNWNALASLLSKGERAELDASIESFRGSATRARMDTASRLLYHAHTAPEPVEPEPEETPLTLVDVAKEAKGEEPKPAPGSAPARPRVLVRPRAPTARLTPPSPLVLGDVVAIVGLGRVGSRVGRMLRARGVLVRGTKRTPGPGPIESADRVLPLDLWSPEADVAPVVEGAKALVYAAAPGHEPGSYDVVYGRGLLAVLAAAQAARVERVLVLGSVGVHGEDAGGVVSESAPPEPRDAHGRTLLAAETAAAAAGGVVLRLAGLYAKGRGPQSALARAPRTEDGRPRLRAPGERWLNLVHEEDAARAVLGVLDRFAQVAAAGRALDVSDGCPVRRSDFYGLVARAAGLPGVVFDLPVEGEGPSLGKQVLAERARALLAADGFPRFSSLERAVEAGELP